ncbi:MAG: hypothetical protein ABL921_33650 [Pirellula sp.]
MKTSLWKRATAITCSLGFLGILSMQITPSWSQSDGNATNQLSQQQFMAANRAIAPAQVASVGTAMMASVILANGFQQLAVMDHAKSTIAVYHIDPTSGDIQLKSVRRIDADFALEEFNLSEPTPSTIRKNVR